MPENAQLQYVVNWAGQITQHRSLCQHTQQVKL